MANAADDIRGLENQFRAVVRDAVLPHVHKFTARRGVSGLSTAEEDTKHSFDMRVGMYVPVSVRIREFEYLRDYGDFTIRSKAKYGGRTEINKLTEDGAGSAYFYGWMDQPGQNIIAYALVDIEVFRAQLAWPCQRDVPNGDGTRFNSYSLDRIRSAGAMVAESGIPQGF